MHFRTCSECGAEDICDCSDPMLGHGTAWRYYCMAHDPYRHIEPNVISFDSEGYRA